MCSLLAKGLERVGCFGSKRRESYPSLLPFLLLAGGNIYSTAQGYKRRSFEMLGGLNGTRITQIQGKVRRFRIRKSSSYKHFQIVTEHPINCLIKDINPITQTNNPNLPLTAWEFRPPRPTLSALPTTVVRKFWHFDC